MNYVDLVLLKEDEANIYMAPKFSMLKPDDHVVVVTGTGNENILTVKDVISVSVESDEYRFILELAGQKRPLKITKAVHFNAYDYGDGDADEKE